jgi:hypothetical protein
VSPDPFDDVDRALASGLSALAPDLHDADAALASMRPRFERARTRARLVKIGGTVGALVLFGSLAILMAPSKARSRVSVSSQTSTPGTARQPSGSSTTSSSTTSIPVSSGGPASATVPSPATVRPAVSPTTVVTVIVPATGPRGAPGSGPGGSSTTTTVVGGADVHEYGSPSGSISVRFSKGALSLVGVSPGKGIAADVSDRGPDRVEVRFISGGAEQSRIEIRVENGQVVRIDHSEG